MTSIPPTDPRPNDHGSRRRGGQRVATALTLAVVAAVVAVVLIVLL
jgi:hypothetical protein